MADNVYERNGYANREVYLDSLATEYGVPLDVVENLADMLGPNEDFDGLVSALDDLDDTGIWR